MFLGHGALRSTPVEPVYYSQSRIDSEASPTMPMEKPEFRGESEVSRAHSPQSIGSMITVRLSDAMLEPPADGVVYESTADKSAGYRMSELHAKAEVFPEEDGGPSAEPKDILSPVDAELMQTLPEDGEFTVVGSLVGGSPESTLHEFRSRSNSSGTLSSVGSAHVDWDELDKSEEQAPRDECSDEVCCKT